MLEDGLAHPVEILTFVVRRTVDLDDQPARRSRRRSGRSAAVV
jgi:hypothetical protein